MIDMSTKTASVYTNKYIGRLVQSIVAFPDFDEDLFPLLLIKEWEFVVIFNIRLKHYVKVTDIDTKGEIWWLFNQRLCYLEKENNEYRFITYHQENSLSKFRIPNKFVEAALKGP